MQNPVENPTGSFYAHRLFFLFKNRNRIAFAQRLLEIAVFPIDLQYNLPFQVIEIQFRVFQHIHQQIRVILIPACKKAPCLLKNLTVQSARILFTDEF